jgi:hypothetical protein
MLTDEQTIEALINAGIPKLYHAKDCSLGHYGEIGKTLRAWVSTTAVTDMLQGQSRFLIANSPRGTDIFFMLARGMLFKGLSVKVLSLLELLEGMQSSEEGIEFRQMLGDTAVLFLWGFYIDGPKGSGSPLNKEQQYWIEWLLSSRVHNRQAIVFESTRPPLACNWYRPSFLKLIQERSLLEYV